MIIILFLYILFLPYFYLVLNDLLYIKHYKNVLNGFNNRMYSYETSNSLNQGLRGFDYEVNHLFSTNPDLPTILMLKNGPIKIIINDENNINSLNTRTVIEFKLEEIILSPIKYYYQKRIKTHIDNVMRVSFINTLITMNNDITNRIHLLEGHINMNMNGNRIEMDQQLLDYRLGELRNLLTDQRRIIDDVNLRVDILVNERYEKFKFLK